MDLTLSMASLTSLPFLSILHSRSASCSFLWGLHNISKNFLSSHLSPPHTPSFLLAFYKLLSFFLLSCIARSFHPIGPDCKPHMSLILCLENEDGEFQRESSSADTNQPTHIVLSLQVSQFLSGSLTESQTDADPHSYCMCICTTYILFLPRLVSWNHVSVEKPSTSSPHPNIYVFLRGLDGVKNPQRSLPAFL